MPKPTLQLPILQNWSCHSCGGCCRLHRIFITDAEKKRIEQQGWTAAHGVPEGQPLFVEERQGRKQSWWRLAHQPDGACVFLDDQGLCRIHARFDEPAKPLACRIYPYAFHAAGGRMAVSLRFSCPSVAGNLGTPVSKQLATLQSLVKQAVPQNVDHGKAPALSPRVTLAWSDTQRVLDQLDCDLSTDAPIAVKLLRTLFWIDLLRQAKLDTIRGERLSELLELLSGAAAAEIATVPELDVPSSIGLTQFRLLAGLYARMDTEGNVDRSWRGRWRQLLHGWRLARGTGDLPEWSPMLRSVPVAAVNSPQGPPNAASEEMLSRYFRVKVQGWHFFGRPYYGIPLIEGWHSLCLTYPAVLWIARWLALSAPRDRYTDSDVAQALNLVDHQHGYSPALGSFPFRRRVQNLATSGDIEKLIIWSQRRD